MNRNPTPRGLPSNDLLAAGGETGALARSLDWSATPLGAVENWPQSLRTAVQILLTSRFSMWMGWGPDLTFLYNDAYRRDTLGRKHPWAFGRPAREVWAEIWNDIGPRIQTVLSTGTATWDEALLLFLERSGYPEETYHTFSYSPLMDDEGRTAGMFCVVMEETERVIGERRLTTLRELAAALAATSTATDVIGAVERSLAQNGRDLPFALLYLFDETDRQARLTGHVGAEPGDAIAPPVIDIAIPDSIWPAGQVLERTGAESLIVQDLPQRFDSLPTGAWDRPPKQAVLVPIAQPGQGRPAGFLVAGLNPYRTYDPVYAGFIDLIAGQIAASLSNAQAYEAERERAQALAELDRAKTIFFSNVSHEFRTPLTLMLGPLEQLLNEAAYELADAARQELQLIHRNALRLLKLANTLLDFSRIEAGRTKAVYEPVDLAAFTAELASSFRSAIERADLELVVDTPPLPDPVYVDRDMWEKIVLNFLSNAFKFTFEGRITVSLNWAGDHVVLAVSDTGIGIPEKEIPHVFDRFHRVEGVRGRTHEGSGIGLALVQELVRLHGGVVTVQSTLGEGTTFQVRIPTGRAHLPADQVGAPRDLASTAIGAVPFLQEAMRWLPDSQPGEIEDSPEEVLDEPALTRSAPEPVRGARILLADDNSDMREYIRRLLIQQEYRVEAVSDGFEALAAARRETPDLVLSDIMMPGLDGNELLQRLRADPVLQQIPIMLVSARAGEEARIEGIGAGADDYIVKPFSARELLARVGAHLELARVRRAAAEHQRRLREVEERARIASQHAEARLREIFLHSPAIIATLRGPEHVFESANPLYLQFIGRSEIIGKRVADVLPETVGQGFVDLLDRVYRTGEPFHANEMPIRLNLHEGGELEERYASFVYQPLRDPDGTVSGILAHAVDVTAQVLARQQIEQQALELEEAQAEAEAINEELQQTNDELAEQTHKAETARAEAEEANKTKSRFLATMSHELRTPLNAIIGYSDLLDAETAGPLNDPQRKQLERIVVGARHLLRIIDEILTFSRIEAGHEAVHLEEADVASLIRETAALIEPLATSRGLDFAVSGPEHLPLNTDTGKVRQIVLNLLSNAVKFTDSGAISIHIYREDGAVLIRVKDTGIGIHANEQERIFEPFTQVKQPATRLSTGTGLGLSVTRHLVRLLGGDVTLDSEPGKGSVFTVRLPHPDS